MPGDQAISRKSDDGYEDDTLVHHQRISTLISVFDCMLLLSAIWKSPFPDAHGASLCRH
jgi:hypothetical protein